MTKKIGTMSVLCLALTACGGGGSSSSTAGDAQAIVQQPLTSIDIQDSNFADLAPYGAAIGDARIVVLNESMHGDGYTMRLNARLLKYLHEEKGFDVLLIESGMFDTARMIELKQSKGISYTESAPGRIFYGWSKTQDGQQMIKYLNETQSTSRPLNLVGIDQMAAGISATTEVFNYLEQFLSAQNSLIPKSSSWTTYRAVGQKITELAYETPPAAADLQTFLTVTDQIKTELCNTPYQQGEVILQSKSYWCRVVSTMENETRYLWSIPKDIDHQPRDISQAANARWYLEGQFKGKKAVLWTHTLHGLINSITPPQTNTASELAKSYPGQIHTTLISIGKHLGASSDQIYKTELESILSTAAPAQYISYPTNPAQQAFLAKYSVKERAFEPRKPNSFGTYYQSLFYIPTSYAVWPNDQLFPTKTW
jgi:erythromycin esterase